MDIIHVAVMAISEFEYHRLSTLATIWNFGPVRTPIIGNFFACSKSRKLFIAKLIEDQLIEEPSLLV